MRTCADEKNQGWSKTKDVKQAGETEIQQMHTEERETEERKREEEVIKNFQRSKFPEGYYSWCGEHTSLAQPR